MREVMNKPIREADERVHLGVSWYPEMWPESEWPKDIEKMREAGFTLVRLFEFAWKRFEPAEGTYDFDWALRLLDQLEAAGIGVMVGTPTAAPPAWLTSRYPEVLGTGPDGKRKVHGKRKHYNPHSVKYRALARGIAGKLAEVLGKHPAVHSWQIDNEMSGFDYGEETVGHFHDWLAREYGRVEALNESWGLQFWSQAYDRFEQIPMVTAEVGSIQAPERHHPSLIMAIARFQNEGWTRFINEQAEAIRAHSDRLVTTNMTGFVGQMDWFRHFRGLDRCGASMYADLSYYYLNYIRFDRLRGEKPVPFWLLETAPNWSGGGPVWNIHHNEQGIEAFSWMAILTGGSMVLYWQWRGHWAGQEMQHGTCVSQTGKWMPGKAAWVRLSRAFAEHGSFLLENPAQRGPVGIVVKSESSWLFSIDPIHESNRYAHRLQEDYELPLVRRHYPRDILHEEADFAGYRVLLLPQLPMLRSETRERLAEWVRAGGQLLLGPMTGTRSEEMTTWTEQEYGGLEELMGAEQALRFSPHWVEDSIEVVFTDGKRCHPRIWCDAFGPAEGTRVLAHYEGGYGDGLPAVVERDLGKGRVITLGCPLEEPAFVALFERMAGAAGVEPVASGGEAVLACPRVDGAGRPSALGLINTVKEARRVALPEGVNGQDVLSGERCEGTVAMEPLQVRLIRYSFGG